MEILRLILGVFFIVLLSACTTSSNKIREECRQTVITYQDAIECMIKLDNKQ